MLLLLLPFLLPVFDLFCFSFSLVFFFFCFSIALLLKTRGKQPVSQRALRITIYISSPFFSLSLFFEKGSKKRKRKNGE